MNKSQFWIELTKAAVTNPTISLHCPQLADYIDSIVEEYESVFESQSRQTT